MQAPEDTPPPLRAQHSRPGAPRTRPWACHRLARQGSQEVACSPSPNPCHWLERPVLPSWSLERWACGHRRPRDLPGREGHVRIWLGRHPWGGRWEGGGLRQGSGEGPGESRAGRGVPGQQHHEAAWHGATLERVSHSGFQSALTPSPYGRLGTSTSGSRQGA